jgi:hypothetical protein
VEDPGPVLVKDTDPPGTLELIIKSTAVRVPEEELNLVKVKLVPDVSTV